MSTELLEKINQLPLKQRHALLEATWQGMFDELFASVIEGTNDMAQTEEAGKENFPNLSRYQAILRGLSRDDLEIFFLYAVEGMGLQEIADIVGTDSERLRYQLLMLRTKIRFRARGYVEEMADRKERAPSQLTQISEPGHERLSQRLKGILKFDGDPPNDEEAKDLIADYLIKKYS